MDAIHNLTRTHISDGGESLLRPASLPWHIIAPTAIISYLSLVQLLRFRALRAIQRKYAAFIADPYKLNYRQAAEIMRLHQLYDTPFLFYFGTQWALVKSYGMATGTPLLARTRQLCDPTRVGRRAEDTAILLVELLVGDLDSERGRRATARLNWMHNRYASRIHMGDYVHTLALFVLEPARWIDRYDWRALTYLETVAYFVYWRELARRMGFGDLVPETLEALEEWKAEYERMHMYFIPENQMVAGATLDLFLRGVPRALHGVVRALFVSFIDEKPVRDALGFPDPPLWAAVLTPAFFRVRGILLRYCFLPRAAPMDPLSRVGKDGRLYRDAQYVGFEPWYVANTWYNRLQLWLTSGGKSKLGGKYGDRGYVPEELGPAEFEKLGRDEVLREAEVMKEYAIEDDESIGAGCPLAFGR
ncbi:hypothetical protein GGS26DRAFT_562313 [Hypomontagnella submonticulosa]|nr:hypothetical protein GGS26DRAFT_562313 [Hypomontagnella submonticulosa]